MRKAFQSKGHFPAGSRVEAAMDPHDIRELRSRALRSYREEKEKRKTSDLTPGIPDVLRDEPGISNIGVTRTVKKRVRDFLFAVDHDGVLREDLGDSKEAVYGSVIELSDHLHYYMKSSKTVEEKAFVLEEKADEAGFLLSEAKTRVAKAEAELQE